MIQGCSLARSPRSLRTAPFFLFSPVVASLCVRHKPFPRARSLRSLKPPRSLSTDLTLGVQTSFSPCPFMPFLALSAALRENAFSLFLLLITPYCLTSLRDVLVPLCLHLPTRHDKEPIECCFAGIQPPTGSDLRPSRTQSSSNIGADVQYTGKLEIRERESKGRRKKRHEAKLSGTRLNPPANEIHPRPRVMEKPKRGS